MIRQYSAILLLTLCFSSPTFAANDRDKMIKDCHRYEARTLQLCLAIVKQAKWKIGLNAHTLISWGYTFPRSGYKKVWQELKLSSNDVGHLMALTEWDNSSTIRNTADGFLKLLTGQGQYQVPIDRHSIFHPENKAYVLQ